MESPSPQAQYPEGSAQVLDHVPAGILCLDVVGKITYLNSYAQRLLDCDSIVVGHLLGDVMPSPTATELQREWQRALMQQQTTHLELEIPTLGLVLDVTIIPQLNQVWLYLQDATLRKHLTQELIERARLSALSSTISTVLQQSSHSIDALRESLQVLVEELEEIGLARVWLLKPDSTVLELALSVGDTPAPDRLPEVISPGISIIGLIARDQKPYLSNDFHRDLWFQLDETAESSDLLAFAGYPLKLEERLVGVLAVLSRARISDTLHEALQGIAGHLAIGLDRVNARDELIRRQESLLFSLASQIRNSLDLDNILATAVHEIRQLMQIDHCMFLWCWTSSPTNDDNHAMPKPVLAITHEAKRSELPSLIGECSPDLVEILADIVLNLTPLVIEDTTQAGSGRNIQPLAEQWRVRSQIIIPIETRAGQLGALIGGQTHHPRTWSQGELDMLHAVADQLAIAIDQAELYAQSRATAFAAQTQAQQLQETLHSLRQTQSQLIQSEKMSSLGQLVAGIAHEINNPVNFISGNLTYATEYFRNLQALLQLYQQYYPDPHPEIEDKIDAIDLDFLLSDLENLLNSMQMGTERICKIVLSLRNFSRLDEAEVKAVDLHEGLDNTLLILHNRLKSRGSNPGIEIIRQYGVLPKVNCYASQLNQVFMNILSNAIDALEETPAPRQITIQTDVKDSCPVSSHHPLFGRNALWVTISIRDNGSGIESKLCDRIFDPFFTTKPVGQGTGLGLSISYQIVVERHKGLLQCNSAPGQGTEFTIQIPIDVGLVGERPQLPEKPENLGDPAGE